MKKFQLRKENRFDSAGASPRAAVGKDHKPGGVNHRHFFLFLEAEARVWAESRSLRRPLGRDSLVPSCLWVAPTFPGSWQHNSKCCHFRLGVFPLCPGVFGWPSPGNDTSGIGSRPCLLQHDLIVTDGIRYDPISKGHSLRYRRLRPRHTSLTGRGHGSIRCTRLGQGRVGLGAEPFPLIKQRAEPHAPARVPAPCRVSTSRHRGAPTSCRLRLQAGQPDGPRSARVLVQVKPHVFIAEFGK